MDLDIACLCADFEFLEPLQLERGDEGVAYRLKFPSMPMGRGIEWAELRLPRGFPSRDSARIVLSKDAILRIPHVESDGKLCIEGDPGPFHDLSAEQRLIYLLDAFETCFLEPWRRGELDQDFNEEPLNYWHIRIKRERAESDAVRKVWTFDEPPKRAIVRDGRLLTGPRCVVLGDEKDAPVQALLGTSAVGVGSDRRVVVADIPISEPLTPLTWPRDERDIERILKGRLRNEDYERFKQAQGRRGRTRLRIVVLRTRTTGFAFLMGGGPASTLPLMIGGVALSKTYPAKRTPTALSVERLDPSWTVARDQCEHLTQRRDSHVLVFGAGALGSFVIEYLARAGVGTISIVDPDTMEPANIGRHLLGFDWIGSNKAIAVARRVGKSFPSCKVHGLQQSAQTWLERCFRRSPLKIDLVVDLTGEVSVRQLLDRQRQETPWPMVVGWMEPYVAAAHCCKLPSDVPWSRKGQGDCMERLQAVSWPDGVIQNEPGCSSTFQSYTAAAAAYAVAMLAEETLGCIDGRCDAEVVSWVRGQRYLDQHAVGLTLRDWALPAGEVDAMVIRRAFPCP